MNFLDRLTAETNVTSTENGAKAYSTTGHACLDFFAMGAATRNRPYEGLGLFQKAYWEDKQTAVRTLFYIRDIRGGQGERNLFRVCLKWLSEQYPNTFEKITEFCAEYGRWDDILAFYGNEIVKGIVSYQLYKDSRWPNPSLLAKWMPSENTSSKETQMLARQWQKALGLTPAKYRKLLSKLRKKIHLLEQDMSANRWGAIDYSKVPSQAFRKHTAAFKRHDAERFEAFLNKATKQAKEGGPKLIKTSTLYTYEVFDLVQQGKLAEADALWANLPDYEVGDALVMADVSGSMYGRPMSVSVSLALYFAERAKGAFHNKFMTFSADPQLVSVNGETLQEKMQDIETSHWDMNTDFNKAMDAIFEAAKESKPEEVPKVLYVISDMEFDATQQNSLFQREVTPYKANKAKWDAAGLQMPTIVFWNVNSHQNQVPVVNEENVVLISGSSQSTFRYAVKGESPMEAMRKIVNSERYARIVL